MFVATRVEFDWKTGAILSRAGYLYIGPVLWGKGATAAQTQLAASQTQFYNTLSANYKTQFANNAAILSSLQTSLQPILSQGINGYGFNPAEDVALRTQATEGTAAQYSAAAKTLGENISAQSGNTLIPSGAPGQLEGQLATTAAQQEANQQLGITEAGYAQGRQNYTTAANLLGGVASQYNPIGYAGAADSSGTTAFNSDTTIQKENAAASPWGAIGGILGGVAGSFLGPMGTSLGSSLGKASGGAASGSSGGSDDGMG